jgi:hypothetical protein
MDFARRLPTKGEHRVGSFLSIGRNPLHAHMHLLRADNTRKCRDSQIAASNKQSPRLCDLAGYAAVLQEVNR